MEGGSITTDAHRGTVTRFNLLQISQPKMSKIVFEKL